MKRPIECDSDEGKIVDIIDGINTFVKVLNNNFRDTDYDKAWEGNAVKQALLDLAATIQVSFGDQQIRVVWANAMGWSPDKLNEWWQLCQLEEAMANHRHPGTQPKTKLVGSKNAD